MSMLAKIAAVLVPLVITTALLQLAIEALQHWGDI